jgi:aspartyl-tRNA(Asn)/glutamyl-tRNA(Gln) amidotransferase subunit B
MENYIPTIGLEIHAELKTKTKMFCGCLNDPMENHPNINICPVCAGHPGTLPVINIEAVKNVLRTGLALKGQLADFSRFDRKNYFYPDLPKGYQISQYKFPLVSGGFLNKIRITRIHLEEDTGRLQHTKDGSLVDLNRAGVPLMELVTEPDIKTGEEARKFAEELRLVLRYLDVSDADMEKGQMRIEANISVRPERSEKYGTKVEVKNINSFKSVEGAIKYEIERQKDLLEKGGEVSQETRGWDDIKQKTFSQRSKEEAHDYRYFPEPDLPPFQIGEIKKIKNLEATIPELPWQKRERLKIEYGLKEQFAEMLVSDTAMNDFFENTVSEMREDLADSLEEEAVSTAINYITSDLAGIMREKILGFEELLMTPENFADLMVLVKNGKISSRAAKDVLLEMVETGAEPHVIISEKGLEQTSDSSFLENAAKRAVSDNPKAVDDYRNGKEAALQFLVGMVMKETKGKSNPEAVRDILAKILM